MMLGVVLAGGLSTRYGSPKALATVGGRRIVDRAAAAVLEAAECVVAIANDPEIARAVGIPARPDVHAGLGALGGIHSALIWAAEEGRAGALVVACDMPFVSVPLLRRMLTLAPAADVVAPESGGRRGIEPLCACYATSCLPAIDAAIARGDTRVISFHDGVRVERIALEEVRTFGEPATLFLNVNTPEDRERAERIARETAA
jgi:molybdopterin-guanine dinucleotide biosynthesis protein A